MSQHDMTIDNAYGAAVRLDINAALQALASNNSGGSAPSVTFAGMTWLDTSTTPPTIKWRNQANSGWNGGVALSGSGGQDLAISAAGNVGIGTASPNGRLSVFGTGSTQLTVTTVAGGTDVVKFDTYHASGYRGIFRWYQQGSLVQEIDASGNVGFGVTPYSPGLTMYRSVTGLLYSDVQNPSTANATDGAVSRVISSNVAGSSTASLDLVKTKSGAASIKNTETDAAAYLSFAIGPTERFRISSSGHLTPGIDNTQNLGSAPLRYGTVYAGTGTINTSDEREKNGVRPLTEAEGAIARELAAEIGTYQFLSALKEKGERARLHVGMTVQRAIEIFDRHGIDPMAYGVICHDAWPARVIEHPAEYEWIEHPAKVIEHPAETRVIPGQTRHIEARTAEAIVQVEIDGIMREAKMITSVPARDEKDPDTIEVIKDTWVEVVNPAWTERGAVLKEAWSEEVYPAGERFGFRVDELLLLIAKGFDARLSDLESMVKGSGK